MAHDAPFVQQVQDSEPLDPIVEEERAKIRKLRKEVSIGGLPAPKLVQPAPFDGRTFNLVRQTQTLQYRILLFRRYTHLPHSSFAPRIPPWFFSPRSTTQDILIHFFSSQ